MATSSAMSDKNSPDSEHSQLAESAKHAQQWQRISHDGSLSAYSREFDECYHSLRDGALSESLHKHIYPALRHISSLGDTARHAAPAAPAATHTHISESSPDSELNASPKSRLDSEVSSVFTPPAYLTLPPNLTLPPQLTALDICFGLGYNSLLLLATLQSLSYRGSVRIYSPELDSALFPRLCDFPYPREITEAIPELRTLLQALERIKPHQSGSYRGQLGGFEYEIVLYKGDALTLLARLELELDSQHFTGFEMIYQDAFSPKKNPALWSEGYFATLSKLLKPQGIITTYSQARAVREAAHKAGLLAYDYHSPLARSSMLFAKVPISLPGAKERK